jgi:protein-tyrosine phosphatase
MGARILQQALPDMIVASAGIGAVVGACADPVGAKAAAEIGVDLDGHTARQLTEEIGGAHDLILVMEQGHRAEISRRFPQLSGRTMLFDHWSGGKDIADPYRKPIEAHRKARDLIAAAAGAWAQKLRKPGV